MAELKGREKQIVDERLRKIERLRGEGVEPYPHRFELEGKRVSSVSILEDFSGLKCEEKSGEVRVVAGRVMTKRAMGRLNFFDVQDFSGVVQVVVQKGEVSDEVLARFKDVDVGDIVGVEGEVVKTKSGEVSIMAGRVDILTKAILPLPDKHKGLRDKEERYRKRYLDLIMNGETRSRFIMRSRVLSLVREFLDGKGFVEVETPILQVLYGGTNAKPFTTHINAYDMDMYLRVAPELYLKRLLVGGFEKVYEVARNFRNEGADQTHNPEFTMIEWYEAYGDYESVMNDIEGMCKFIAGRLFGREVVSIHGKEVDISGKWPRIPMTEAILKHVGVDVEKVGNEDLRRVIDENGIEVKGEVSRGQMIFSIFDKLVAGKLFEPTWVIDYPKEVCPLQKMHRSKEGVTERFELYMGGYEISDGWSEINDPIDQRERFESEQRAMRAGDDEAHPMDEDFLEALQYGMPPAGGMGMGIDRLVMLFSDCWSIRDVMLFPTMKPERGEEKVSKETKVAVVILNGEANLERWQQINAASHLSAAFGARGGRKLFMQDSVRTRDGRDIGLNIQHAIMIKEAGENGEVLKLVDDAREKGLEVSEFTREMLETTDDRKVAKITAEKDLGDVEYIGVLVFGKKSVVDKLTKNFELIS